MQATLPYVQWMQTDLVSMELMVLEAMRIGVSNRAFVDCLGRNIAKAEGTRVEEDGTVKYNAWGFGRVAFDPRLFGSRPPRTAKDVDDAVAMLKRHQSVLAMTLQQFAPGVVPTKEDRDGFRAQVDRDRMNIRYSKFISKTSDEQVVVEIMRRTLQDPNVLVRLVGHLDSSITDARYVVVGGSRQVQWREFSPVGIDVSLIGRKPTNQHDIDTARSLLLGLTGGTTRVSIASLRAFLMTDFPEGGPPTADEQAEFMSIKTLTDAENRRLRNIQIRRRIIPLEADGTTGPDWDWDRHLIGWFNAVINYMAGIDQGTGAPIPEQEQVDAGTDAGPGTPGPTPDRPMPTVQHVHEVEQPQGRRRQRANLTYRMLLENLNNPDLPLSEGERDEMRQQLGRFAIGTPFAKFLLGGRKGAHRSAAAGRVFTLTAL